MTEQALKEKYMCKINYFNERNFFLKLVEVIVYLSSIYIQQKKYVMIAAISANGNL
jgi:hypothetical protein